MFLKALNMFGARCSKNNVKELCAHLDIWDELQMKKAGMLVLLRRGLSEREVHSRDFLHFCVSLLALLNLPLSV